MTTQPSGFVGWTPSANPLYIVEPTAGQKTTGWVSGEAPPFQYLNWMFYMLDQWTQFLAPAMTDGAPSIPATSAVLTTSGTLANDSNQLTSLASVVGLIPGLLITGAHILAGTYIQSISGNTVTMSTKASSASISQSVSFSQSYASGAVIQTQIKQLDAQVKMMIPVGTIFATFPKLAGTYITNATTAADDAGFVLCGGQTISDATSPMNGVVVPNINDSCFIMGLAAGGDGTGGGANSLNLAHTHITALAAHTHNLDTNGGAWILGENSDGGYGVLANFNGPTKSDLASVTPTKLQTFTSSWENLVGKASSDSFANQRASASLIGTTSAITSGVNTTSDSALSSTQDIRPKFISAVYLMKVR